jgi:hypothetical protein
MKLGRCPAPSATVINDGGGTGTWDAGTKVFSASLPANEMANTQLLLSLVGACLCAKIHVTVSVSGPWTVGDYVMHGLWPDHGSGVGFDDDSPGGFYEFDLWAGEEALFRFDNMFSDTKPAATGAVTLTWTVL